jgi:hypothetical protein
MALSLTSNVAAAERFYPASPAQNCRHAMRQLMIRKSGRRFSEEIMRKQ